MVTSRREGDVLLSIALRIYSREIQIFLCEEKCDVVRRSMLLKLTKRGQAGVVPLVQGGTENREELTRCLQSAIKSSDGVEKAPELQGESFCCCR